MSRAAEIKKVSFKNYVVAVYYFSNAEWEAEH
jgi:hypothetical protein